jgi:uncharacterized protein YcaQ
MIQSISREEARRFLATYHFTPTDLPGAFARLGTVQYDPLNPIGRNPDLVLQARIPGYQVDDWQQAAYTDRIIYDAWDKQACLVPSDDWPFRALTRTLFRPYHDREILTAEPDIEATILHTIDTQGPLSSLEFEDKARYVKPNEPEVYAPWYGTTKVKRILRAMWACGTLVTHHRKNGRHYYDRPERVIPAQYYQLPPLLDAEAYYRWMVARRVQAAGLLRPMAEAAVWSACGDGTQRKRAIAQLVEDGTLTPIHLGDKRQLYYMLTSTLPLLNAPPPPARVIFLGPLDSLLWDRKAVTHLFDFEYLWEVYKPLPQRRWGYYVLPVFYGNRFIARFDSRLEGTTWTIYQWWWEPGLTLDDELHHALTVAFEQFLHYLRADTTVGMESAISQLKPLSVSGS